MVREAFLAGVCTTAGTTLGKLAVSPATMDISHIITGVLLIAMLLMNALSTRFYLLSLDGSPNSVNPTVISAGCSYVLSAFFGMIMFEEEICLRWWVGVVFILLGFGVLIRQHQKIKDQ